MLFADAETVSQTTDLATLFPPKLWASLVVTTIFFVLGLLYVAVGYKVADWITPGKLCHQLMGTTIDKNGKLVSHTPDGKPNVAVALVAAAILLGIALVAAAAIH